MDNTGAVTKRLIYHYDGTTLCKITDEYANVIEYYSYDDDYKVPNEYPIKLTEVINNDKQFKS